MDNLEYFEENLPHKPYSTNDLTFGLQIRSAQKAKHCKYIQFNGPSLVNWIVLDIDRPDVLGFIEDEQMPPPNIICINSENGHAHLLYRLEQPVCTSINGRAKPQRLLHVVTASLISAFKADSSYTQLICKNPLSKNWITIRHRTNPWGLSEFFEWIDVAKMTGLDPHDDSSMGADRHIFDIVSRWTYEKIRNSSGAISVELIYDHATKVNVQEGSLLSCKALASMAKRISRWTAKHYTGTGTPSSRFIQEQRDRGKKAAGQPKPKGIQRGLGTPRWRYSEEHRKQAFDLHIQGLSNRKIATRLGVTKETIKRWIEDQGGGHSDKKILPVQERIVNYPIWYQTQVNAIAPHTPQGLDTNHVKAEPAHTTLEKLATVQTNNAHEYDRSEFKKSPPCPQAETVQREGVQRASPFGRISARKYSAVLDFFRLSETSPLCLDSVTLTLYCLIMQAQTHGQFFHIEAYSRKAPKKRARKEVKSVHPPQTVRSVLAEAMRVDGHCPHIDLPQTPTVLYGCSPTEVEAIVDDWAASAQDEAGHKLRIDGKCLLAGVTSVPNAMTENEWQRYKLRCLTFLTSTYGERLRSVVAHLDEGCRHLHFYVVPLDHEPFDRLHPGRSAAKAVLEKHKQASNDKPPSLRDQNAAYKSAMAAFQDKYFSEVASDFGLSRKGPQGKRLTRKEYFALKENFLHASQARDAIEKRTSALTEQEAKIVLAKKTLLVQRKALQAEHVKLQRPLEKVVLAMRPIEIFFRRLMEMLPSSKQVRKQAIELEKLQAKRQSEAEDRRKLEERLRIYDQIAEEKRHLTEIAPKAQPVVHKAHQLRPSDLPNPTQRRFKR